MFQLVLLLVVVALCGPVRAVGIYPGPIGFGGGPLGGGLGGGPFIGGIGHHPGLGVGGLGLGGAGFGQGFGFGIGAGGLGLGLGHKIIGGEQIDHNIYGGGKKNVNNGQYYKSHGNQGGELNHGDSGFSKGEEIAKNLKGESAHFSDTHGGKKLIHDGKDYYGGDHFEKEGHGGGEKSIKKGHKKGHTIKGYKSSHHKDETGKTEHFYDEEHDEAGNYAFDGQTGSFGEKGANSFKGGHEDGKFNSGETKKTGHYGQEYITDKAQGNHGGFGERKYAGHGGITGEHKLLGSDDIAGHHENSQIYKHIPIHF